MTRFIGRYGAVVVAEYLRVDEIAHRFDVTIDDVLAACSVLGFPAHDESSPIELDLFTQAVKSVHLPSATSQPKQRRLIVLSSAAAMAAALVAVVGAFVIPNGTPGQRPNERAVLAATYRDALQSTYESAVGDAPTATDYRALAQELSAIEPPPGFADEHAAIVAEAQTVAELAGTVTSAVEATTAAETLEQHITQLEGTP